MSAPFTARVAPLKILFLAAMAVGLIVASVFCAVEADDDPVARGFGIAGILFFGLVLLVTLRQFGETGPVLRIGPQGFFWSRWSDETIPWAAFTHAEVKAMRRQTFLCLTLRDRDAHRSTHLLGRLARANALLGFGDIAVSAQGTDQSFEALVDAVAAHAPQLFAAR